jgi:4-amino-4-deoxy-L-arabinose transferase-like glycosyltransferase
VATTPVAVPVEPVVFPSRPSFYWRPVFGAALAAFVVLTALANRYGYHRDELYFRMLKPAWGYVDQPPLTPLLARAAIFVFGDSPWGMRVPANLCVALATVLIALTTRELGGGRGAQAIAAWGFAFAAFPMVVGHLLITATVDLAVWALVILFVVRALLRDTPRWWLLAGAVVGLSLYNKLLVLLLLVGLAVGLLAVGPRSVLRSGWVWAGVLVAVVVGSPNLIYQATHDWPQLQMAGVISTNKGPDTRVTLLPFQFILMGPPMIWLAGFTQLRRRPTWRPVRALAIAYLVVLALVLIAGGQIYYPFGLLAFLFAAGAIPAAEGTARLIQSRTSVVVALCVSAVFTSLLALPLLPVTVLGHTPIPAINQGTRDQIGWPTYIATLRSVYSGLSPSDQARAVVLTGNYGEAGAVDRYFPEGPTVYSGHNELWTYGPPPQDRTVAVVWTEDSTPGAGFASCDKRATMDNGVGVDNEEQGSTVWVCRDPVGGWAALWPSLRHLG